MKVVLYIGHHKVGSTALQQFLAQNSHRLMQHGILYPAVESQALTYNLAKAIGDGDEVADLPMNVREPHNALAYRMWSHSKGLVIPHYHKHLPSLFQMKTFLKNQIDTLAPHTVILCSEVMANFGKACPALIDTISTMFGPDIDLEIYCALRRPDEYLTSWHGQKMRFGDKLLPLRDGGFERYLAGIHFNYEIMLRPWIEQCPDASFKIRPYGEVISQGGSIQDFFNQVGVDLPADLLDVPRLNSSYPLALYEVIRRANHALERPHSEALRSYLMSIQAGLDLPANHQIEMFGDLHRQTLYKAFLPVEQWLRSVTGKPAFFTDLDEVLTSRPIPETDVIPDTIRKIQNTKVWRGELPEAALEVLSGL